MNPYRDSKQSMLWPPASWWRVAWAQLTRRTLTRWRARAQRPVRWTSEKIREFNLAVHEVILEEQAARGFPGTIDLRRPPPPPLPTPYPGVKIQR